MFTTDIIANTGHLELKPDTAFFLPGFKQDG
jgi:hypothetical protein